MARTAAKVRSGRTAANARHAQALAVSSFCAQSQRQLLHEDGTRIGPLEVIRVLIAADVDFVLMGTYGIVGWRRQGRATKDVHILVKKKDHRTAVAAIVKAFPDLQVKDYAVVTRFTDPTIREAVIDLMKPAQEIHKAAFSNTIWVDESYQVPNLEMALVSKFAAMTSPNRSYEKKLVDGGDFVEMVKKNYKKIDRTRLALLANKVYRGGAAEIVKMIDDLKAGRRIEF